MVAPASVGVAVKTFYIGLFCVMVGAFAELLLVRGYTSCFNLGARWAIQVAAEYSIYGVVIGSWAAYKESSRIKGALLMVSMFFLGSLPSMGYIIMQFYKLSPGEYSKDPLYFVLARRHMREVGRHIKGPSTGTARAIFSALAFYMMGVLTYTIIVEIFNPPNINKCMVSNVIDIYVHFAAISVWVAYKESRWTSAFLWILSILCFRGYAFIRPKKPCGLCIHGSTVVLPLTSTCFPRSFQQQQQIMTLISEETIEERGDSTTNNNLENNDNENNINNQILESSHYSTPTAYSNDNNNIETPGGSRYWLPYVKYDDKPIRGKIYGSFEESFRIYKEYAIKSGFDIKLSSSKKTKSGMIKTKYIRCNKHGDPPSININTLDPANSGKLKRKSTFQVTGCNAHIMIKLVDCTSTYKLHLFVEEHNHPLNPIEYRHLSKENRKLGMPELMFMKQMADSNYGATVSYNLYCNTKGGYSHVSGTKTDFKNFKRDLNVFIGESDAQMLVTKLTNREEYVKDFSFSCDIKNSELECFFWADETAKANYKEFGDIISFDATYCTNRYSMIFVPFTAIDNHKKCVTIGAGMLRNETTETYIWLLKAFLDAFKKQPRIILTDQDPAMKRAIATVFPETKHRLCMWHIVTKFTVKIDRNIIDHTNFRPRLHQLIWNRYHKPEVFEQKWISLLQEFNLEDNVWLEKLFEIRSTWIPAYFIEYEMCGLMRTTSRSESENSFFNHFTSYGSTLINFMNLFESAMEKQRHEQEILDHQTLSKTPKLITRWPIEEHARNIYTKEIFFLVQEEIDNSLWWCSQISITTEEGCEIMMIKERTKDKQQNYRAKTKGKGKNQEQKDVDPFSEIGATEIQLQVKKEATFKVKHNIADETYVCTCNHFVRCGILCRHIFCVLQSCGIDEIPEKYIARRWKRDLIPPSVRNKTHRYEGNLTEKCQKLANEACRSVESCIAVLRNDEEKLAYFVEKLKNLKIEVEKDVPEKNKTEMMEDILGVKKPDQVLIHNPKGIKNKGSGSNSRMQGYGERAQKANERPYRTCGLCELIVNTHDRRTCKGFEIELENLQKLPHLTHQQQQQIQRLLNSGTTTTEINAANQSGKEQLQQQNVQPTAQRQTRGKKVARQAYKDVSEEESDYGTYDTLSNQRKRQKTTTSNAAANEVDYVLRDEESDYETSNVDT